MKLHKKTREAKLTSAEKQAILAGDYTALKRSKRPEIHEGQTIVLRWSRGGKQFIERSTEKRMRAAEAGDVLAIEIPRRPTVWVEFSEPQQHGNEWRVAFTAHDEREPTRLLAGPPNPPGEPGLKTRWQPPSKVPERGAERRSWTTESERGYGGGKASVDEAEGVDDATLSYFAQRVEEENDLRRSHKRDHRQKLSEEARLAAEYRKGPRPQAVSAIQRRIKRAEKRANGAESPESPSAEAA